MPIIEPVIRPPAEADSFLLQVTSGCSSNNCTFCGAYLNKPFSIKDQEEILDDIRKGASRFPRTRRVCLLDGDALVMKNDRLVPILKELCAAFPRLARISAYANGYNISRRSGEELHALYDHKLRLIYMGLESGNQQVLDRCRKRSTADEMVEAVQRCARSGIKSSVIILLGLGGRENSSQHVRDTAAALNRMQPRYLSFLSLMSIPGTILHEQIARGEFTELKPGELLREAHDMIAGLQLRATIFRSNHASNYLPLAGRLPHDKERLLASLCSALEGKADLKPDFLRGL
ncbi:MAG: radical SAM protein [Candidatus Omnitrophota bacterium]